MHASPQVFEHTVTREELFKKYTSPGISISDYRYFFEIAVDKGILSFSVCKTAVTRQVDLLVSEINEIAKVKNIICFDSGFETIFRVYLKGDKNVQDIQDS